MNTKPIEPVKSFFQSFVRSEAFGGILLVIAALIAFLMANSPLSEFYFGAKKIHFSLHFGDWVLEKELYHWINDGLMVLFFLMVGLEIKRELLIGELSKPRDAALAVFAAIGGMVVPALIYVAMNFSGEGIDGWGIPMATDIAFAIGIISLLGKRAPLALKVFITALAIVDDMGAVLVIALFYTESLNLNALIVSLIMLSVSGVYGFLKGQRLLVYTILGIIAWYYMLKSGVHATIAGVLLALTIPLAAGNHSSRHDNNHQENHSPLHIMEHGLSPWVNYFIMPLFALTNAGVMLSSDSLTSSPILFGSLIGLLVGKPIGIFLLSWLSVKAGWASLPKSITWIQLFATGMLAGIGFTMSFFIAVLAFGENLLLDQAKIGILCGSLLSAVGGLALLYMTTGKTSSGQNQEHPGA